MHVEISRIGHDEDVDAIAARRAAGAARRPRVRRGLGPDAPAGRGDRRGAAGRPARLDLRRRARARRRLPRVAVRRPLHVPRLPRVPPRARRARATTCAACPAPATASCATTPTCRRRPASCRRRSPRWRASTPCWCWPRPTPARPCTARRTSTTSASRCSTTPARSSASVASSACSPAPPTPSPSGGSRCCARRPRTCSSIVGLDPHSHAGKALIDTLETYPRDELFHTPVDELATDGHARHGDPRPSPAADLRTTRHLRPLRQRAGLPAPRPLQHHRPRALLRDPQGQLRRRVGRVHRPDERVDDGPRALRGPPAARAWPSPTSTSPSSSAGSPTPRARGATTSPPPRSPSSARTSGRGSPAPSRRRSPRPTRRTSPRPPARSTSAGSSALGEAGTDLSLFSPLDAARGEARLKVFRRGAPISLSAGAAGAVVDGRRGRRRAALPARPRRPPVVHLRVRAALRARHARPHARGVPGHHPRGVGRLQRDRRLQRARPRRPA